MYETLGRFLDDLGQLNQVSSVLLGIKCTYNSSSKMPKNQTTIHVFISVKLKKNAFIQAV